MRLPLASLVLACAALVLAGLPAALATECSPIPQVVSVRCLDVPSAGGIGILRDPSGAVQVVAPGYGCGTPIVGPGSFQVTCTPLGATLCLDPFAFGMAASGSASGTMQVTASCGGAAPASCSFSYAAPGGFCTQTSGPGNTGSFPITCAVTYTGAPAVWYAECAQPVG